jgi:hypothetical protein
VGSTLEGIVGSRDGRLSTDLDEPSAGRLLRTDDGVVLGDWANTTSSQSLRAGLTYADSHTVGYSTTVGV